jgi:hypothetical protein
MPCDVEIALDEEVLVGPGLAGEAGVELGDDGAPGNGANGGRQHAVEHLQVRQLAGAVLGATSWVRLLLWAIHPELPARELLCVVVWRVVTASNISRRFLSLLLHANSSEDSEAFLEVGSDTNRNHLPKCAYSLVCPCATRVVRGASTLDEAGFCERVEQVAFDRLFSSLLRCESFEVPANIRDLKSNLTCAMNGEVEPALFFDFLPHMNQGNFHALLILENQIML